LAENGLGSEINEDLARKIQRKRNNIPVQYFSPEKEKELEKEHQRLSAEIIAKLAAEKKVIESKKEIQQERAADSEYELFNLPLPISAELTHR